MKDYIYHYTDIETLALILRNKTMRFNRLDKVDDISEGESFKKIALQKFLYVSCWTRDEKESIPQWHMYTRNMAGVRIKFPKNLFYKYDVEFKNHLQFLGPKMMNSPVRLERLITDKYFILNNFSEEDNFCKDVKYDRDFAKIKNDLIKISQAKQPFELKISDISGIASLKSPDWSFQKEFRFVLLVLPLLQKEFSFWQEKYFNSIEYYFRKGESPLFNYFDIEINNEVLNTIEITTGPLCTEGEKIIISSLLEKYTENGSMNQSVLSGTIRSKR